MYLLIAYLIAFKVIDITEVLMARLGRGVTLLEGKGGRFKKKAIH